ncbi:uncharacterized protein LOC135164700 isoform X2 [Diachasmimorpha longicaudata]|uniref:uncharacterized protein LOC135164700 isoform X2 n=1 Tax=Diachasmimorpha longicaudata TaxID=58733 RepID=UPI0030B8E22E
MVISSLSSECSYILKDRVSRSVDSRSPSIPFKISRQCKEIHEMSYQIDETGCNEGRVKKVKAAEGQRALATDCNDESEKIGASKVVEREKISGNVTTWPNEIYHTIQAILLASTILVLSYHGLRYGPVEYSLLENGQSVHGMVTPRKAVVTLSLGYSFMYSVISSLAAFMLVYSLVSAKPYWSLPTIVLCIAEVVWEVGDAIVAVWLLFTRLRFTTALTYTAGAAFVIMGELWCWLGVVRLYELRSFE